MKINCHLEGDQLVIGHENGQIVWKGTPSGDRVQQAIANPNHESCIVLLDYMHRPKSKFRNIECVSSRGEILWRSELPEKGGAEAYVEMDTHDGQIVAWSWSGYFVKLDPGSGRITSKKFTK